MKRSRFTEEQIIEILKEREADVKTADVCRSTPDLDCSKVDETFRYFADMYFIAEIFPSHAEEA